MLARIGQRVSQGNSHRVQSLIACPKLGAADRRRRQQMRIDVSDAFAVQFMAIDVAQNLVEFRYWCQRQLLEQFQGRRAMGEAAAGNFADDKGVHHH